MKTHIHILLFLIFTGTTFAQVGIGTTSPNAQLDIRSSNESAPANTDGILIPKIDEFPSTSPTALQDGMMVYLTGDVTPGKGFYYWDNTGSSWVALSSGASSGDHDWYTESTTIAPTSINDDIYTQGNVAIGKNTASYPLDIATIAGRRAINIDISGNSTGASIGTRYIATGNTSTGSATGLYNLFYGSGTGNQTGVYNSFFHDGDGIHYGIQTLMNNSGNGIHLGSRVVLGGTGTGPQVGSDVEISNTGSGSHFAASHYITGASSGEQRGTFSRIDTNGNGRHYASYNWISGAGTGNKYGCYNRFTGSGGTHYGVYANVDAANGDAGYFLGDVYVSGILTNPSARFLKRNITPADAVIKKLMKLDVKSYNYRTTEYDFMNLPEGLQTGFIAEELEVEFPMLVTNTIHPEAYSENDKGENIKTSDKVEFKSVSYVGLVPHLVKALQEQQKEIEDLKTRLSKIEALLNIESK
ncbi:tail fiber domain-containing protein [Psychroserpens ponticola]|uniref:Tail fiber domain-containing protein n=1 Tax=Psychroserpens ponticola TaxID=2932268 RepID=A0ABY7S1A7_9FLAO|nr:tail fiber domain-containing protein [Psychroserpens ponticola]WCO02706.1 tail fiber domain-containing protein [Psychroserpens ponticola]